MGEQEAAPRPRPPRGVDQARVVHDDRRSHDRHQGAQRRRVGDPGARVVVVHPQAGDPDHQREQREQRARGDVDALPHDGGVDQGVVESVEIGVREWVDHAGVDELGRHLIVEGLEHEVELAQEHDAAQDRQQHQPGEDQVARDDGDGPPGVAAQQALARRDVVREQSQMVDGIPAGEAGAVRQILPRGEIRGALALPLLAGREVDIGRHRLPVGGRRLALQPRAPPRAPRSRRRRPWRDSRPCGGRPGRAWPAGRPARRSRCGCRRRTARARRRSRDRSRSRRPLRSAAAGSRRSRRARPRGLARRCRGRRPPRGR